MARYFFFLLAYLFVAGARAQRPDDLDIQTIPTALLPHAHTVVRLEEVSLDVESAGEMTERHHRIISILDKQGLKNAYFGVAYDQFRSINAIRLELYDATGKSVKTYKQKDFSDRPFYLDNVEMALQSRYLSVDLSNHLPPFTLDLKWEILHHGILDYPNFIPQDDYFMSVETANYEVHLPQGLQLHYDCRRSLEPELQQGSRSRTYSWHFQNLTAIPDEIFNLPVNEQSPVICLSPGQFELEGRQGSFDSWDALARWNQQLLDALPPLDTKTVDEIRSATANMPERKRIRAIYRMVQNSTRYISIQLGIGGWQPFDPNFVHTKKYGDCKALAWYTRALLQAAGIKAWYTLIYRGDSPEAINPAFPDHVFNHVILTVPTSAGDTIWLECTSQTDPFGYISPDISDRQALLVHEGKGTLIQMPVFSAAENIVFDSVHTEASDDLKTARVYWTAAYSTPALDDIDGFLTAYHSDAQAQKNWLEKNYTLKGRQLQAYALQLDTLPDALPTGHVNMEATSNQLFNLTPKRLIFQLNFFRPWGQTLLADSARVSPFLRRNAHTYLADFSMNIPAGWTPESLPAAVEESNSFGTYSRIVTFQNGQLHYRRSLSLHAGVFSPTEFPALVTYFGKLKKWDEERAIFVR